MQHEASDGGTSGVAVERPLRASERLLVITNNHYGVTAYIVHTHIGVLLYAPLRRVTFRDPI